MKKMLLHVCCAPCSTHVIEMLKKDYNITLFFYNPNVEPIAEYELRLTELEKYAKMQKLPVIVGEYDNIEWHAEIAGHENDTEGGERCDICFRFRLEKTAQTAEENGFDIFATTLTVSPFKNAELINKIGKELEKKYGIEFLEYDFKKNKGYMQSVEISRKYGLYRQKYCGCFYSKR